MSKAFVWSLAAGRCDRTAVNGQTGSQTAPLTDLIY